MMPGDAPVWEAWLARQDFPEGTEIDYDVKVGESIGTIEDMPDPYQQNAIMLSKKRIDAVVTLTDRILIVEVKARAGWTAIGQILGYVILFQIEFRPTLPVEALLLANTYTLDTRTILDALEIPYEVVPLPHQP